MASTAGVRIGWALANVAVQNGTSFVVVLAVCGLSKYCGGSDTKMVIDLQVWVARTIGSLAPILIGVLRVASKDWLVRWIS
jgi:hypothetical protein